MKSKFDPVQSHIIKLGRLVKPLTRQIPNWCSFDLLKLLKDKVKVSYQREDANPTKKLSRIGQNKVKINSNLGAGGAVMLV